MLGIGRAEYIAVRVEGEQVGEVAANSGEVGDDAVVHEDVAAEDEGVGVDLRDDAAGGGANVREDAVRFGVVAERLEVEVVEGWGLRFVECWARAGYVLCIRRL